MGELRCQHVAKSFAERRVLSDIELTVPQGTLTAVLGASGSGKTTLLRVIIGFVHADRGRVVVGQTAVADAAPSRRLHLPSEKRAIGYVAQEGALYPHLSVGANVGFGLPRRERKAGRRIAEVLELVGLDGSYASRGPHQLSGGEQRRVALARALAPRPALVLLDEPFSGLDAALRAETREAVSAALAEQGTTAVLVTHDQGEALSLGREVAVLRSGRLVQTATPEALYGAPADLETARFVGEAVVLAGHARGGILTCRLGELPLVDERLDGAVKAMIRPEQIEVRRPTKGDGPASVTHRTYYGPMTVLRMALDGTGVEVTARLFSHGAPQVGERVALSVTGPVMAYPETGVEAGSTANALAATG